MKPADSHKGFAFLYRTRVKVYREDTIILNLSLLFMILAVLSAPWLVIAGGVFALVLGYRFRLERNAAEFSSSFDEIMQNAAQNVKNAMDSVVENPEEPKDS